MRHPTATPRPRRGFTLIEMLMVIVVMSILISLLVVAVGPARQNVRIAQVRSEISSFDSAFADFRAKYGKIPPSRIVLREAGGTWTAAERAAIMGIFGTQFNFGIDRDINGNGTKTDVIVLTGAECLVFWLGGLALSEDANGNGTLDSGEDADGNGALNPLPTMIGFSTNPADPFSRAGSNRVGPFFDFKPDRLRFLDTTKMMPVYFDSIPGQSAPYLFASSVPAYNTAHVSPMTNYYRQGSATGPAWNPKTFQIISPGFDFNYGPGGLYDPKKADTQLTGPREAERDNITNFASGLLSESE